MDTVEDLDIDEEESEPIEEESYDVEQDEEDETPKKSTGKKARSVLTGRGVTLAMLLHDKILDVGEKCLSIDYLGQKFQADLLPDGKIKWPEANKVFNSPSAWAIYCKRLVNPSKNSGCGWASVKYKGRKLDQFKTTWFRKQRPDASSPVKASPEPAGEFTKVRKKKKTESKTTPKHKMATSTSSVPTVAASVSHGTSKLNMMETPKSSHIVAPKLSPTVSTHSKLLSPPLTSPKSIPSSHTSVIVSRPMMSPPPSGSTHKVRKSSHKTPSPHAHASPVDLPSPPPLLSPMSGKVPVPSHVSSVTGSSSEPPVPLLSPPPPANRKRAVRSRLSVKYSTVSPHSDPQTLVELINFTSTGRMQPFSVDIAGNCLLLMDYHCHLTTSEVVGYLAGRWDPQTHHMKILQAFPCRCRFADKENAPKVEEEIRNAISQRGLMVLGWYHSHPTYQPDPSVQDIRSQQQHQKQIRMQLENTTLEPCLGMVVAPYDTYRPTKESTFRAFWVQSPNEASPDHVGMPMHMNYTTQQDQFLSQDLLNELCAVKANVQKKYRIKDIMKNWRVSYCNWSCLWGRVRWLWSFYKGSPDTVNFQNMWYNNQTYLDKVKSSLIKKFPTDQTDGRFLEFINTLLS